MIFVLKAYSQEFEPIVQNTHIFYSINQNSFSSDSLDENLLLLKKDVNSEDNKSYLSVDDGQKLFLKSDYDFLYKNNVIGIDSKNFKIYKLFYKEGFFFQELYHYDELQLLFDKVDVIKISDFQKGKYNILTNGNEKKILLFNDIDFDFSNYSVKPDNVLIFDGLNCYLKLQKRGRIILKSNLENEKKSFVIRVR